MFNLKNYCKVLCKGCCAGVLCGILPGCCAGCCAGFRGTNKYMHILINMHNISTDSTGTSKYDLRPQLLHNAGVVPALRKDFSGENILRLNTVANKDTSPQMSCLFAVCGCFLFCMASRFMDGPGAFNYVGPM